MKTTSLHDSQARLGARMTEFAGWELPLFYSSILDEVKAVRQRAGLFDVSHMGRLLVTGRGARDFLQRLTTNDVSTLEVNRGHYNLLCNENGGIVDDLTVFHTGADSYILVVNAANTDKDILWMQDYVAGDVGITEITCDTALLALQGPQSANLLNAIIGGDLPQLSRFSCADISIAGVECVVCRSGYSGELGYEIRSSAVSADSLWDALLAAGPAGGMLPCGLGARDVLRIEAGYVLYGHEIDENINPIQAGLSRFVSLNKPDFVGRSALQRIVDEGATSKLSGIRMADRTVPRPGAPILAHGRGVGSITSGTFSPTIMRGIGLAYVDTDASHTGLEVEVVLREKPHAGLIVQTPFH